MPNKKDWGALLDAEIKGATDPVIKTPQKDWGALLDAELNNQAPSSEYKVVDEGDALQERMRLSSSLRDMTMGTQMRNIHNTVEDAITSNPTHLYNYLSTDDDSAEHPSQGRGKALTEKIQPTYNSVKGKDKDFVVSKYVTADKLVDELYPASEDGTIEIDGYKYPKTTVSKVMRGIVEDTMHPELFATNKAYRSNYFMSNFGKDEQTYYTERLSTLDKELNDLLQMIRNESSKEAQSMTSAANQFGYSQIATPAMQLGLQESMGANIIRDAIDQINSLKKGNVWSGINEGFDWVSALTLSLNDIASSASLSRILDKVTEDKPLTPREQLAFKAYTLSKEVDSISDIVGRKEWNEIGTTLGKISEFALPMAAPVKLATTGVKMTSLGVKEALATTLAVGKKSIPTAIGRGILETVKVGGRLGANVARAEVAGAMLAPFTPTTWANFAEKRLQQYSINDNGKVEFKPSLLWKDIVDTEIEQTQEIASEIFGMPLQNIIGKSAKTFGRLIGLDVVADKIGFGADKRFFLGLRKPAATRELERTLGFAGLLGEGSSEVLGEYLSESLKSVITGNGDVSRLNNWDFWKNTLLVSTLYGGALSVATLPLTVSEYTKSNIYQASKARGVALSRIDNRELRNRLLSISAIDDMEVASQELAKLDWGNVLPKEIAAAMDFVRADYTEKVLLGDVKENMRMNAYAGVAFNTVQYVYCGEDGQTPTDDIISIDTEDGRYMVISGILDNASDSELICRDANGKIVPIHASKIKGIYKHSLQEEMGEQYKRQFGVQIEQDRQQEVIEKLNKLDKPTKEDIANIMASFGAATHQQGEQVTLVDGRKGVVDSLEDDGTYVVKDNTGAQLLSVPFYDVLAEDATMAEAQQRNYTERSISNIDEYAQKVEDASTKETIVDERNGISIGDIVTTPDGHRGRVLSFNDDGTITIDENLNNTSGNLADAYAVEIAEADAIKEDVVSQVKVAEVESPAETIPKDAEETTPQPTMAQEIKPIPRKEDGSVDYDAIDDPVMFAEQFSKDMGGAEAASMQLAKMKEASRKEIEKLTAKGETLTAANEVVSNRKAVEALNNKAKLYSEVIKELNPEPKAGVIENEYSLQLDPKFKKFINTMAEAFGLTVEFVEGIKGNAQISGNKVKISWEHRDKGIKFLIGHEFTHRMQDLSPEQYAKFKDSVKEFLGEEAWNERLARMKQTYIYNKERFDRTLLEDEVVADFVGQLVEQADAFDRYINSVEDKGILATIAKVFRSIRDFIFNAEAEAAKPLTEMLDKLDTFIESAEATQHESQEMERMDAMVERGTLTEVPVAEATENVRFSLTEEQATAVIEAMKANAEVAPQLELTPENWVAEFGEAGKVTTPIGKVKMSEGQYQKMQQQGRNTKLGMVKPTLTNPDVIIEEDSKPKDGKVAERNSSFVFVKAFTNAEGTRDYMFTSVSNRMDGIEIVMSNQEKETPRVKRLLKEGKLAYINKATLPSELTDSAQGDQLTIPSEVSYSANKDTRSIPENQINEQKFSLITPDMDASYLSAVERGDMETAQQMVMEAAKMAMPNTKVVDENGNPKVVYHGSNAQFTVFDTGKIGSSTGTADGRGFYFTTDKDYAQGFATPEGKIFGVFLNIENPLSYDRKTITKAQLEKIFKEADEVEFESEGEHYMLSNYADYTTVGIQGAIKEGVNLEYNYADNDVELIGSIIAGSGSFELIMNAVQKVTGKSSMIAPKANNTTHYIVTDPKLIKSADPVTYDDNGNVIPLSERFDPEKEDIRYSLQAPTFYSNAEFAVRNIKQEKATPEQWLKMIEKAGGLKAGEDKWLGLSDWLKASDKKTLTKDEILQYIADNNFVIEEVEYAEQIPSYEEIEESAEYQNLKKHLYKYSRIYERKAVSREKFSVLARKDENFRKGFDVWGSELQIADTTYAAKYLGLKVIQPIHFTRKRYTTDGLDNKREIALVVPYIEPYNQNDEVHFGDAGEGRAVAWIRFGETTDAEGNRVLVIDEIQSKRHQDGREKGYSDKRVSLRELYYAQEAAFEAVMEQERALADKYGEDEWASLASVEEMAEYERLRALDEAATNAYENYHKGVPSAPFEKNWAELAMKRMLRYAAENGFDKVAWTTGEQQADRYNIGNVVSRILSYPFEGKTKVIILLQNHSQLKMAVNSEGVVEKSNNGSDGQNLADIVGKDLANKIMNGEGESATVYDGGDIEAKKISGDGLRIGGEGMKAFYDQMLPSFMNKYGKKWGVKVGEVTMPNLEENNTMHSVDVTKAMRESVMQGQPRFSLQEKVDDVLSERAAQILELCNRANTVYAIKSTIIVAATREDFVNAQLEAGYTQPDETAMAAYLDDDDVILLNSVEINTQEELAQTLTHENAHSITHTPNMWNNLFMIHESLNTEDIRELQEKFLPDYNDETTQSILDEIISNFVAYLSTKKVDGVYLLRGYLSGNDNINIDVLVDAAKEAAVAKFGDKYAYIVDALLPLLADNLKVQKERYERQDSARSYNFIRHTRRSAHPSYARGGVELRGNLAESVEGEIDRRSQKEGYATAAKKVDTQYSLHTAPMSEEEQIRIYLRQKHLKNREEIRKKYRAYRSVARLHYKEERAKRSAALKDMRSYAAKVEFVLGDLVEVTLPFEHQALAKIARGEIKMPWEALSKELGLKKGEKRYYSGIIDGADANTTFDGVVHQWWEELGGYELGIDTQDLRNALIDALSTASSSTRALSELREIYDKDRIIKNDALDATDRMEDEELAAEDARYAEEEARFNENKDNAVEEFIRTSSFYNQIEVVDATVMKIREHLEKTQMVLTHRQQMRYYQGLVQTIAELKQSVKDIVTSKTIEVLDRNALRRVIDKIDKARSVSEVDSVLAEIEEISLNATIKAQMKNMGRMLQLRLPDGVSVEEWVNAQVKEGRLSRADGDAILRDKWKGRNAKGVSVAKKVDPKTAAVLKRLGEYVNSILALKGRERVADSAIDQNKERVEELETKKIAAERKVPTEKFSEEEDVELQARQLFDKFLQSEMLKKDVDLCLEVRGEIEQHYYGIAGKEAVRDKYLEENRKSLNEINRQRKEVLEEFNDVLLSYISTGRDALSMFRQEQSAHKAMVVNMALDALGVDNRLVYNAPKFTEKIGAFVRSVPNAPYYTFQTTLREIDRLSPNGEGRFYNYFMTAWADANNNFITQHNSNVEAVADALSRILGVKGKNNAEIIMEMIERSDDKPLLTVSYGGENAISGASPETKVLTLSNALYVIAMWRQPRYRASMEYHGFTQEMFNTVYDAVMREDERYITFVNWVNETLLPETRLIYDKVHKEMFGASMANERNYFPARLVNIEKTEDVSLNDVGALPSTMTGAIVNRVNSKNMINLNMNYFRVLMSHLQEMDQWSTFAPLIRDLNAIVSNGTFKQSCNTIKSGVNKDRSGAGSLFTLFKTTSAIAVNCYRPSHSNSVEDFLISVNRGWAGANITYRGSTALKQLASSPVFAVYATDPKCMALWAKNSAQTFVQQRKTLEWAIANSPMFKKRWDSKFAGMDVFESTVRESDEGVYNAIKSSTIGKGARAIDDAITKFATDWGMTPNAFIDAMTVANGIRTIYEYEIYLAEKRNGGKPATEKQKHEAMIKAEIAFNESQQSSESAFVSQWQTNRTYVTRALSTYQNSAYGFHRLRTAAANEFWKQRFSDDYINRLVDVYGPVQAKEIMKDARKKAFAQLLQGTIGDMLYVMMGASGNVPLFTLVGGDDDEGETWDLLKVGLLNIGLNVTTGGYALGSLFNSGLFGYSVSLTPAWDNIVTKVRALKDYDFPSLPFAYQALNIVVASRYGVDFDTLANIVTGIEGLVENESKAVATMKILNIPQSQINLVVGKRREGETVQEYVARSLRAESIGSIPYVDAEGNVKANKAYWQNPLTPRKSYVAKYKGEYDESYRRSVITKFGGNNEYREFVKNEEEYKDVVKALGWRADTKPNNNAYINGKYSVPPINGLSEAEYGDLWYKAAIAAEAAKAEGEFVGTDDCYYGILKELADKRQELIDRYNEL